MGVLGEPSFGFSPKEKLLMLPMVDPVNFGTPLRFSCGETTMKPYKPECLSVELEGENPTTLVLSLHALHGSQGNNIMRVVTTIGFIILINSGSTHNFVDAKLVKTLNLSVEHSCKLKVIVSNEGVLLTQGHCKAVSWTSQGNQFVTNFLSCP
ncbi:hypothetical protein PVK06_009172 [Gossypium arboreum]|uniref:Uncharacterized protein n=1 Tax=Gossypium arboreum TaxID=29729 RepID=A0ABR0QLS5_GOSAR|nr:hypothetical protein PVK06_009172 [Gossypium arboreum]